MVRHWPYNGPVPVETHISSHPIKKYFSPSRPFDLLRSEVSGVALVEPDRVSRTVMPQSHHSEELKLSWNQLQEAGDPELVRQLRAGNDDALAVIVDRYQRLVLSVALRIVKNQCEAEDVVQTVFVKLGPGQRNFPPVGFQAGPHVFVRPSVIADVDSNRESGDG